MAAREAHPPERRAASTDGISFVRAFAIVLGVVAVATIVAAWRAARTNPLVALRHR
jgi:ABC-type lipoprotein release transport system permease subunit